MRTYIFGLIILAAFIAGLLCGGTIAEKANSQMHEQEVAMVKSVDCFWGGDKCVPGTNIACKSCKDGQSNMDTSMFRGHGCEDILRTLPVNAKPDSNYTEGRI